MERWHEIWICRDVSEADTSLESLIRLDGFDTGAGKVDAAAWQRYCKELANQLKIAPLDTLFEVGCGAGALLHYFHAAGNTVAGIDLSPALITMARRAMPGMSFAVAEAKDLTTEPHDFVLSCGVFHYFPDLEYAGIVLSRMLSVARKGVAVLDLPDLQHRDAAEAYRRSALPPGDYENRYRGLDHCYYSRDWFIERLHEWRLEHDWELTIQEQWLASYGNAPFRFNVLLTRKEPR